MKHSKHINLSFNKIKEDSKIKSKEQKLLSKDKGK